MIIVTILIPDAIVGHDAVDAVAQLTELAARHGGEVAHATQVDEADGDLDTTDVRGRA